MSALNKRKKALEAEREDAKKREKSARTEVQSLTDRIKGIEIQLLREKTKLTVSDHAIVRYLERAMGIDTSLIAEKILAEVNAAVTAMGDGKYALSSGETAVVKDGTVVTVTK